MKKINNKISVLLLAIILIIISFIWIIVNGKTYTLKINIRNDINDAQEINTKIEPEGIVSLIDKKLDNGVLKLKVKSIKEGKAHVDIDYDDYTDYHSLYVHKFGIITCDNYLGKSTGEEVIPNSVIIFLVYVLYISIKKYKKYLNENMYQYKNITYLGLIIFLSSAIIAQTFSIISYDGLIGSIRHILGTFNMVSIFLLPIAFIVSILVICSNIVLVRKEGLNWRNLLGLIMGVFFCFSTIFPDLLNNYLQKATFIDVHKESGIANHIQIFVESTIYSVVAYLECILISTIVLGRKAAKHIPQFDKDFIVILGCQIKKDGSLTNLLKSRVDRAIEFKNLQKEKTGKDLIFIPSGGQGSDEIISEAQAMKNYLLSQGIDEDKILLEDKSKNTYENIKFSNKIAKNKMPNGKIAFSTTNYHVFRAGIIAEEQNINIDGIGAKTKTYFWTNAFIREFIATLYSEKKKHKTIIFGMMIAIIFMMGLIYVSNIIV